MNDDTPDKNPMQERPAPSDTPVSGSYSGPEIRPSIDLRHSERPLWSGWDVVLIALIAFVSMMFFLGVGIGAAMHSRAFRGEKLMDVAQEPRLVVPIQTVAYLAVLLCMVAIVRRGGRAKFWSGVRWNWPGISALWFLLGGLGLAVVIQIISALLPIPKQLPIEQFFKNALGAYLMAAFGVTVAPLMEELFFRGFLYPALERRIGVTWGVATTGFFFALLHASQLGRAWAPLLLLFIVGVVLTYVRARTGSVARSVMVHAGYNLTLFVVLWIQSDHFHNLQKAMGTFILSR